MSFELPDLIENDLNWGPPIDKIPKQFKELVCCFVFVILRWHCSSIPYTPYSKSDKIGVIADWNNENRDEPTRTTNNRQLSRSNQRQAYGAGSASAFGYVHGDDEASFSLVDNRTSGKRTVSLGKSKQQNRNQISRLQPSRTNTNNRTNQQNNKNQQQPRNQSRKMGWKDWDKPNRIRDASVQVQPDWEKIAEIEFSRLNKLNLEVGEAEDIASFGSLHPFDRTFDRVTTKAEKPLEINDRTRYNPTTSVDPIIQKFAEEKKAKVFATDSVLSVLMTSARSVYPWDLMFVRKGDQIFIDKREGGPFDFVSVNENAADPPMENDKENINTPGSLSFEATYLNHNFTTQVVNEEGKPIVLGDQNPFYSGDEPDPLASCGYKYRKFNLAVDETESMDLIVRTELDAYIPKRKGQKQDPTPHITIKALNEFDYRAQGAGGALDWRSKLDTQRGAVLATEMKNNSVKLARWAVQSVLAGAEILKMGLV